MSKLQTSILIALFCISFAAAAQTSCKALVLEAGGDLGAYEAGVIQGLVESYQALGQIEEVYWDVFSGVSVGAINAAGLGQFAKKDTVQMAAWVVNLWKNIKKSDIYTNYLGGIVQGLVFEESLFKTDPLRAFLNKQLTKKQQRKLSVGVTNANTGEFERFDEKLSVADTISALMASSAVPALFPYQIFRGNTYFDGGVIRAIDVYGAIEKCLEIVEDPSQITLDVILISSKHINQDIPSSLHPLKVGLLANNIKSYQNSRRALIEGQDYYSQVNWRYIINPQTKLPQSDFPFNFSAKELEKMIEQGISEAKAAVAEQVANPVVPTGDPEVDSFSISAKRAFIEAYEAVFKQTEANTDKTEAI